MLTSFVAKTTNHDKSVNETICMRVLICKMVEGLFRLMQTEKNNTQFNDVKIDYYTTYQSKAFIALLEK